MSKLSVVVITRNEEANIARCLESVKWAEEIIVVDSRSTDGTVEIARKCGATILSSDWHGYGATKQEGVKRASGDWILSIDADEEVSSVLAEEIRGAIAVTHGPDGYEMPRRTLFLGRWIKHCGWYPDFVLRLFRKGSGEFDNASVHEKVVFSGPTGRLREDLLHYSYPTLEVYFTKLNRYTTLAAQEAFENGRRSGWWEILVRPLACLVKQYILKLGMLDGREGFLLCVLSAVYVMAKYAKLRDLYRRCPTKNGSLQ